MLLKRRYKIILRYVLLFLVSVTAACEGGGGENTNAHGNIKIFTPTSLNRPVITGLHVTVSMDVANPQTYRLGASDHIAINGILPGKRDITIAYHVSASLDTILANLSRTMTVIPGQTVTVKLDELALNRNHDSDNDGYTNLAEVRIGTDPHNSFDKPADSTGIEVAGGATVNAESTRYKLSAVFGEPLIETASSNNFSIQHGMSQD